jgi:hypothetical protein
MSNAQVEKIRPLVTNTFTTPDGKVRFSASCFGDIDWSLKNMYSSSDAYGEFGNQLRDALKSVGAQQTYAPTPTDSNAVIGLPTLLEHKLSLCDGIFLRRNKKAKMDGTFLDHRFDAGIFSAGGCGLLVFEYRRKLVFAHGSRESLLDRTWVKTRGIEKGRSNISVVDSIIEALKVPEDERHLVHVWPLYFIKPENFEHRADDPDTAHAEYNSSAIYFLPTQFGKECGNATSPVIEMDLPRIARMQCIQLGIPPTNIHMEHCYLADELPTTRGQERHKRYLVAVVRHCA